MSVSILLRLMPGSRTGGRLAGHAEIVDTGEVVSFRDSDEMVAVLHRVSDAQQVEHVLGMAPDEPSVGRSDPLDESSVSRPGLWRKP